MEIWKDIYFVQDGIEWDYRGLYQVSNHGRVKSLGNGNSNNSKEKILKAGKGKGYLFICLCKNSKKKTFRIHRLVAHMFLANDNPIEKIEVNHIDENKTNNHVSNLEWCTREYNNNYGSRNKRAGEMHRGRLVARYLLDGELVDIKYQCEYKQMGFEQGNISACCNGKLKTHKGFIFKYYEGDI